MITFEDLKSGKVKPEFGNSEHIEAIRLHQKHIEYEEAEKAKKLYEVTLEVSGYSVVKVRAKDEEEAKELAKESYTDNMEIEDVDIRDIEEIKE